MTSIMTNAAAMAALQTLRSIDRNLETTQGRVSSGYRVGAASDNAAYWSIATTMRSDNSTLSTVQDALGLGAAKSDIAYMGLESTINVLTEIQKKLVAAKEPGVDKTKIDKEISQLKDQISSIAQSASFSGENWLYNEASAPPQTKQLVSSFTRSANGDVAVTTLDYDTANSTLIDKVDPTRGLLTQSWTVDQPDPDGTADDTVEAEYYLVNTGTTPATGEEIKLTATTSDEDISGMITALDKMMKRLTDSAAMLGAINSRIDMQESFVSNLMDTINKGVGRLVDADMNEESTRLKALQTQQQLGIQSLSIANSNAQNILQLFQNS